MENINNIPFSFDRNTSKYIAKLGVSHADNSFADGVTLSNVIINNDGSVDDYNLKISYINKSGETSYFNYYLNDD
jgi:ABC-type Zn2+ transport system substrate-binding protein/surface adhesin